MKTILLIISALALMLCSCSSAANDERREAEIDPARVDSSAPKDSAIFLLGRQAAAEMLDKCSQTHELELELLDVKARIHLVDTHIGHSQAEDYTKGFASYIREHNDTLARILFDTQRVGE